MAYGTHPILKLVGTKKQPHCETCKRLMKVPDRCEKCPPVEPCYYCHLNLHHMSKDFQNSQKKIVKQKT